MAKRSRSSKFNLYIIAGCNGAGKTTTSEVVLPELLNCYEFVNADNIARGLSPFNVEKVAIEAGRIMLHRINELMEQKVDFAIETTLSSKNYIRLVKEAHTVGYKVSLIFIWLESPQHALERVAVRVERGGHFIKDDDVIRRYYRGVQHLLDDYIALVDYWVVVNNTDGTLEEIAEGEKNEALRIKNHYLWNQILLTNAQTTSVK
ncbi:MAG: zeta toxin family protein [Chitinophagaceae bacterium]|nr:zeta toxin family protein [Chitinophagaceae bacterium]